MCVYAQVCSVKVFSIEELTQLLLYLQFGDFASQKQMDVLL